MRRLAALSIVTVAIACMGLLGSLGVGVQLAPANELGATELAVQADGQRERHNAYFIKLQDYIAKYGNPSIDHRDNNGTTELNGLCLAMLQDYDRDGWDELLVAYYDRSLVPPSGDDLTNYASAYVYEVWAYENGEVQVLLRHTAQWTNGGLGYVPLGRSFESFPRDGAYQAYGAYLFHETTEYASGVGGTQSSAIRAKSGTSFAVLATVESTGAYTRNMTYRANGEPCSAEEARSFFDNQIGSRETTNYWMMAYDSSSVSGVAPADVLSTTIGTIDALRITEVDGKPAHALMRLYNPWSGEHFYTASEQERDEARAAGWSYEGVGWIAPESGDPVYRLYNPYAGDHHYTLKIEERDTLVEAGWDYEGIGWYSNPDKTVPLYREYNPNEPKCNHNYTTSKEEHDGLVALGWHDEGEAWYGV